jgi:hypothetical protein
MSTALINSTFFTVWHFSCCDYSASAQSYPGGARCAAQCHRSEKGEASAGVEAAMSGSAGGGRPFRRHNEGSDVGLGHLNALDQLCHGPAWGIAQGASRRLQDRPQDVNQLTGFALAHPEPPPLHTLKGA